MQKKFFILLGILIIVLLVAVWGYLFLNANPDTADNVFGNLNPGGEVLPPLDTTNEVASSTVNLERPKLRQLTTKRVIGYTELYNSSSTPRIVYYAEEGTGHIYSINLENGVESRISGTTFAQADIAEFSEDGLYVGISKDSSQKTKDISVGVISTTTNSVSTFFEDKVLDFKINDKQLFYTAPGTTGLTGYSFNLVTEQKTNLFSLPFLDAKVVWGDVNESVYVYPKPSYALEGYLYEIKNRSLNRLPASGFGFSAFANKDMIVYSARNNSLPVGYIYNRKTEASGIMLAPVYPDKCTYSAEGYTFYCAHEATKPPFDYPDAWYKGTKSYKDSLYQLEGDTMSGELLVDTFAETNRELDIINLSLGADDFALYFINKNDNSLWMYEL
jgi:hypothetical protein